MQEFMGKFAGYFAETTSVEAPAVGISLKDVPFQQAMQAGGEIWYGAKNSKAVNISIEAIDTDKVEVKQEYTHVFVDKDGDEVPSTATVMPVTHVLTYKDGKITAWVQNFNGEVLKANRAKVAEAEAAKPVDPNVALARETFEMQVQMAVGTVSPDMIQEFFMKFGGAFAETLDFTSGSDIKMVGQPFGAVMQKGGEIWMGIKNSKCVNVSIKALDASTVEVKQEYTHVFTDADGEEVPSTAGVMSVTHTLTYADGKITAWVQAFDEEMLKGGRAKVMEAEFAKNMPVWGAGMQAWGEGKFSGEGALETAKQFWADDIVVDATYPLKATAGYARYEGLEQALKYIDFLTETDMPDFTVLHSAPAPGGSIVAIFQMTPTVKATNKTGYKSSFVQQCWFVKGKMVKVQFYSAPDMTTMDALFDAEAEIPEAPPAKPEGDADFGANMGVWGAAMGAWGAGKFLGETAKAAAAEFWTDDIVFDFRYPMVNTDGWRKYSGVEDTLKAMDYLATIDMPDFHVKHVTAGPNNTILCWCAYTPTVKATGKTGTMIDFWQLCTIVGGKIADLTFFQHPQTAAMDELFVA